MNNSYSLLPTSHCLGVLSTGHSRTLRRSLFWIFKEHIAVIITILHHRTKSPDKFTYQLSRYDAIFSIWCNFHDEGQYCCAESAKTISQESPREIDQFNGIFAASIEKTS